MLKNNLTIDQAAKKVLREYLIRNFINVSKKYPPIQKMNPEEGADHLISLQEQNEIIITLNSTDDLEEDNVRFGGYFSKDLLGTRFRLDAKPITVAMKNQKKEMLQLAYNFNISLTQDNDQTTIIELFNKWDEAKRICQDLTNKINLKD